MQARAKAILETFALHRGKGTINMPLGGVERPCRHYHRDALKYMEDELDWVKTNRCRYDFRAQRVVIPSWVEVMPPLAELLADVSMPSPPVREPKQEVLDDLNHFIAQHTITGCPQVKLGFHKVDESRKRYGRIHAACAYGISYQTMHSAYRTDITIDGHPTVELDLGASQMRILAAQQGHPIPEDEDPYTVPGVPRDAVKQWWLRKVFSANKSPPTDWDRMKNIGDVDTSGWPDPEVITDALYKRYGWLWFGVWEASDLMWAEGQVIRATVEALAKEGVVALPVFDSIRVRVDQAVRAEAVLRRTWTKRIKAPCAIKRKGQGGGQKRVEGYTIEGLACALVRGIMKGGGNIKLDDFVNECPLPFPSFNKTPISRSSNLMLPPPHGGFRGYRKSDQRQHAQELLAAGASVSAASRETGLARITIRKIKASMTSSTENGQVMRSTTT